MSCNCLACRADLILSKFLNALSHTGNSMRSASRLSFSAFISSSILESMRLSFDCVKSFQCLSYQTPKLHISEQLRRFLIKSRPHYPCGCSEHSAILNFTILLQKKPTSKIQNIVVWCIRIHYWNAWHLSWHSKNS